eukprot:5537338-Amphidinium_carterae.2
MKWGGVRCRCASPSSVPNRMRRGLSCRFGAEECEVRLAPAALTFRGPGQGFAQRATVFTLSAELLVREVLELWATLRETPSLSAGVIPFAWRPDDGPPICSVVVNGFM